MLIELCWLCHVRQLLFLLQIILAIFCISFGLVQLNEAIKVRTYGGTCSKNCLINLDLRPAVYM